ncbi:magnesium transporter CorA family protein [Macrococcus armenti]|uniref:magnesium transporter CorA family protein n=1 Tax=Macrococcus armenti TaxID=2875764 RepID=UPI001CCD8B95|nr:magnesium transporter CorA family protein [Macrococcus armenti]UBH09230.1 magnesium transporter CorA family protein [Macrococcus armenti]UBH11526.1 magnesium transporter CorA family protein [Macrococcus armenti]UBH15990.1 magnesium transporter CorA family protein [Macrococcus armenti]UBH18351.1 magnesium transporter CorA family protein [Macrococcus armenti]UBH20617.1 magnesium transporter CorA family protein [Macrococcus armenti]
MITTYINSEEGTIIKAEKYYTNNWVNLVMPSREEMEEVAESFDFPIEFLEDPLDPEEGARIEYDEDSNSTLVITDFPVLDKNIRQTESYITVPIGIILSKGYIITICSREHDLFNKIVNLTFDLRMKSRFLLEVMLTVATKYNNTLKKINRERIKIEANLRHSLTNKQLYELMEIEKSLVYFLTSLTANGDTIKKIFRSRSLKLYEEDKELLEDLMIENTQALNTTELYTRILESITGSYSSLIANEMNNIMRILTLFTVFLTIPTLVFSFFGMNVDLPKLTWYGTIGVALTLMLLTFITLYKRKMFK